VLLYGALSQFLGWSPASLTTWSVFPFILLHQLYGATGRRTLQPVLGLVARQFNDLVGLSFHFATPINRRRGISMGHSSQFWGWSPASLTTWSV